VPSVLQPIAEWNPVSALTASMRDLWGQPQPVRPRTRSRASIPVLLTLIYISP
jgi:hypothetical protein